jgi:hypothetical protein
MTGRICDKETPALTTRTDLISNHTKHCYLCHCYLIVPKISSKIEFWIPIIYIHGGTRWRSYLIHCATSWKVAGSIPDGVIRIFH